MPSSLATVNLTLLLSNNTHKHVYTNQPTAATKTHALWLCSEQQERAIRGMTTNELHVVLHNPRRPTDRQKEKETEVEQGMGGRRSLEVFLLGLEQHEKKVIENMTRVEKREKQKRKIKK